MEHKMKNMRIKSPEPTLLAARHLPPPTLIQAGPLSSLGQKMVQSYHLVLKPALHTVLPDGFWVSGSEVEMTTI